MAVYDKLGWHYDSAVSAGQPSENALTHIGFYLAWLIRHDLHTVFPRLPGSKWQAREVAGKSVVWASGREFTQAYWTRDGQVIGVAGDAGVVERAVSRLP